MARNQPVRLWDQFSKPAPHQPSALILSHRLRSVANEAERAGFSVVAEHLLHLALLVLDESSQLLRPLHPIDLKPHEPKGPG